MSPPLPSSTPAPNASASRPTGRQRASRIELDYFVHYDGLTRNKHTFSIIAGIVGLIGLAWGFAVTEARLPGERAFSPGQVASVHATWDAECQACHIPFMPIRGDTLLSSLPENALTGAAHAWSSASDGRCQSCHAGPPHHAAVKSEDAQGCASCHHEHAGPGGMLLKVNDQSCTRCHSDLASHRSSAGVVVPAFESRVTRFDENLHPDFRSLRHDPGRIKFSHAQHLTAGIPPQPPAERFRFTLAELAESDRDRYRTPDQADPGRDAEHAVQLDCAACHRFDSSAVKSLENYSATRVSGAYALPVTYERDCRACHPLRDFPKSGREVPHGEEPAPLRSLLEGRIVAQLLAERPTLPGRSLGERKIPGQMVPAEFSAARAQVAQLLSQSAAHVANSCAQCHEPGALDDSLAVAPAAIPQVWMQHAQFDHTAHRGVSCRLCHPRAFPEDARTSSQASDVLIEGRAVCVECHSPRTAQPARGGASFQCVECHRFHGGDEPLHGLGGSSRSATMQRDLRQFLEGLTPEK